MQDWVLFVAGVLLPLLGGPGGLAVLGSITHRNRVKAVLRQARVQSLDQRRKGYTSEEVAACWRLLGDELCTVERGFLRWDLAFPLVYGPACGTALLFLARVCGCTWGWGWLLAPVVVCMVADWIENLVLLRQMGRFQVAAALLHGGWIRVASIATRVKCALIGLFLVEWLVLVGFAARALLGGAPTAGT